MQGHFYPYWSTMSYRRCWLSLPDWALTAIDDVGWVDLWALTAIDGVGWVDWVDLTELCCCVSGILRLANGTASSALPDSKSLYHPIPNTIRTAFKPETRLSVSVKCDHGDPIRQISSEIQVWSNRNVTRIGRNYFSGDTICSISHSDVISSGYYLKT